MVKFQCRRGGDAESRGRLQKENWEAAKGVKGNRKNFYHYTNSKKLNNENVGLLLNGEDDLVTADRDKAKTLCTVPQLLPSRSPMSLCLETLFKDEENNQQWMRLDLGIDCEI